MSTFILPLDDGRGDVRVAIKDLIDVRGTPTTAGCRAVARQAGAAGADAACLAGIRAAVDAGAVRLVGKTNLHELAAGATGINAWFGTPVNPIDARLVPGGSSSGSAVAVGAGEADVALGTDTGGSVRIPSACCGTVGLKTTWGRVPVGGVWPLAPSLDTVGPMARDVAGVVAGMRLLEPGFEPGRDAAVPVGRLRVPAAPEIDAAVDAALALAELPVSEVSLPGWAAAGDATLTVLVVEAWELDRHLLAEPDGVADDLRDLLTIGGAIPPGDLASARLTLDSWRRQIIGLLDHVGVIALPTLVDRPPLVADGDPAGRLVLATAPINGAGLPALALPVPGPPGFPIGLQLVAGPGGEELLAAVGARIEAAVAGGRGRR
jgi:amidase